MTTPCMLENVKNTTIYVFKSRETKKLLWDSLFKVVPTGVVGLKYIQQVMLRTYEWQAAIAPRKYSTRKDAAMILLLGLSKAHYLVSILGK